MSKAADRPTARRRTAILLSFLVFLLLGFFALGRLGFDAPPSSEPPHILIRLDLPGLSPPQIEKTFTYPLEAILREVSDVASMDSRTTSGRVLLDLTLFHRRHIDTVLREVRQHMDALHKSWPPSIESPLTTVVDASSVAVEFTISSTKQNSLSLRDWVESEFAKRLRELPSVSSVEVSGGAVREIWILPDQRRLAGLGLGFEDLLKAVRTNPESIVRETPVSQPKTFRRERLLSGSLAAVGAIPVKLPDGERIQLSEVAQLSLMHTPPTKPDLSSIQEPIRAVVHKQPGWGLSDSVAEIRSHIDWMRANRLIPEQLTLHSTASRLEATQQFVPKIGRAFLIGFVLVLILVYLFSGQGRRTLLFGLITLASYLGVGIGLAIFQMPADSLLLSGMVLGIGLFGTPCLFLFERDQPVPWSSFHRIRFVLIVSGALIPVIVPLWWVGGLWSAQFGELAALFAVANLLGSFWAAWLIPVLNVQSPPKLPTWHTPIQRIKERLQVAYGEWIQNLTPRASVMAIGILLGAGTLAAMSILGTRLESFPDPSTGSTLLLRVEGPDDSQVRSLATEAIHRINSLPDVLAEPVSGTGSREESVLQLDDARARELGVDISEVGKALAIAENGIPVGRFRDTEHQYRVFMRLPPNETSNLANGKILLRGELPNRPTVQFRDVAKLERVTVPVEIRHHQGLPISEMTVMSKKAHNPESIMSTVTMTLRSMSIPAPYHLTFTHNARAVSVLQELTMVGLAIVLVLGFVGAVFRSFSLALIVAFVPVITLIATVVILSSIGAMLTPPAWFGVLLLYGVTAGQVALFVYDCTSALPVSNSAYRTILASRHWVTSHLLTTFVAIVGVLPMYCLYADPSVIQQLIPVWVLGLLIAVPVNLTLVPLFYGRFSRMEQNPGM